MDPNETLAQIRETLRAIGRASCTRRQVELLNLDLRDLFVALDGWLSSGGFPPEAWREGPDAVGIGANETEG